MRYVCRLSYKCIFDLMEMYTKPYSSFNIRFTREEKTWRNYPSPSAERQELDILDKLNLINGTQYDNDYDICKITKLGSKFVRLNVSRAILGRTNASSISNFQIQTFFDNYDPISTTISANANQQIERRNQLILKLCNIIYPNDAMQWDKFSAKLSVLHELIAKREKEREKKNSI